MIVTSTSEIPGYEIENVIGVVTGNTVRARHIGRDIMAVLKNIVGGEIEEYTQMLADARKEATNRMIMEAQRLGADAVVCVRYTTSMIMGGASEILAYGTAVKLRE